MTVTVLISLMLVVMIISTAVVSARAFRHMVRKFGWNSGSRIAPVNSMTTTLASVLLGPIIALLTYWLLTDVLSDLGDRLVLRAAGFDWVSPVLAGVLVVIAGVWILLRYPASRLSLRGLSFGQRLKSIGNYLLAVFGFAASGGLASWLLLNGLIAGLVVEFADQASTQVQTSVEHVGHSIKGHRQYAWLHWPGKSPARVQIATSDAPSMFDLLGIPTRLRVNGFCELADLQTGTLLTVTGRPSRWGFAIDRIDSVEPGNGWCRHPD